MSILIFGGTTEGRLLAQALSRRCIPCTVSVATPLGAEELEGLDGVRVLVGRRDDEAMQRLLSGFSRCVDATHPYAVEATANIARACARAHVPLRRLLRKASAPEDWVQADSLEAAARYLSGQEGNILLTTGAKGLAAFSRLEGARLYPRVLPVADSLQACLDARIPTRNIIAMHGPFTQGLNEAILEQFSIRWLVTKDGGGAGGFAEKVRAARARNVGVIVVGRPRETGDGFEQVLAWLLEEG